MSRASNRRGHTPARRSGGGGVSGAGGAGGGGDRAPPEILKAPVLSIEPVAFEEATASKAATGAPSLLLIADIFTKISSFTVTDNLNPAKQSAR